jgi:hypothetical protein
VNRAWILGQHNNSSSSPQLCSPRRIHCPLFSVHHSLKLSTVNAHSWWRSKDAIDSNQGLDTAHHRRRIKGFRSTKQSSMHPFLHPWGFTHRPTENLWFVVPFIAATSNANVLPSQSTFDYLPEQFPSFSVPWRRQSLLKLPACLPPWTFSGQTSTAGLSERCPWRAEPSPQKSLTRNICLVVCGQDFVTIPPGLQMDSFPIFFSSLSNEGLLRKAMFQVGWERFHLGKK